MLGRAWAIQDTGSGSGSVISRGWSRFRMVSIFKRFSSSTTFFITFRVVFNISCSRKHSAVGGVNDRKERGSVFFEGSVWNPRYSKFIDNRWIEKVISRRKNPLPTDEATNLRAARSL